jgi:hypothetical protein
MNNMKFIKPAVWLILGLCSMGAANAQGTNSRLGGNDEGVTSLSERLLKVEKKSDAFNVFLNMHTSYQEQLNGDDRGGSFKGRQLRLEIKGNLDDHWSYRLRYRLNRPGDAQDDNYSNNIDFMQVNYRLNERWRFTGGKKELSLGGFEFDHNPIQIINYSDYVDGLAEFHVSAQAAYTVAKGHELQAEVFNVNNNSIGRTYPGAGLQRSHHPLGTTLNWTGSMFNDHLQALWAYSYMHEAHHTDTHLLMLGTKLNLRRWQCFVDYYGAWEDIDRHGIVTAETGTWAAKTRYNSVVGQVQYQPAPHWNCFVKGMVEKASVGDMPAFHHYRTSYGYQAAVQWIPDLSQDARLSLAYVGKKVDYKQACGLEDYHSDRIELSFIYRIKAY